MVCRSTARYKEEKEEMQHNSGRVNTMRGKGLNAVIGMSSFKYWTEGEPVCEFFFLAHHIKLSSEQLWLQAMVKQGLGFKAADNANWLWASGIKLPWKSRKLLELAEREGWFQSKLHSDRHKIFICSRESVSLQLPYSLLVIMVAKAHSGCIYSDFPNFDVSIGSNIR